MKQFFKYVFASMVGFILSVLVLFILGLVILGVIISSAEDKSVTISSNSVMRISLDYPVVERTAKNPLDDLDFMGFKGEKNIGLNDILTNLKKAQTDDRIKGIYLDLSSVQSGMATIEEIRNALIDFKKSGKFIMAYSEVYTQGAYYLASVADKIYLNPEGILELKGFSSELMFFKGTLDKLGIEPQIIRVGTYKSAVEPFILDKMSDANREQVTSFMGSMYDHFLDNISKSRRVNRDSLFSIANDMKVRTPKDALSYHLVDGLKYKDEIIAELKSRTDTEKDEDVKAVKIEDYKSNETTDAEDGGGSSRIAVVYASGEIVGGEGSEDNIGSERISRAIRKARTDDKVKALVFRVNSPGGSALASDVIWREVLLTKKQKPVIVSMGDYAASGGYYIACAADSIFVQPNTITGSIGVFGIIPNMKTFFNDKLGITFDGVKTGKYADLGDISRPLTDAEKMIIQKEVNNTYYTFTKHVSEGRKKDQSYIKSIAEGRVWTGSQAIKNGLADRVGNISDAVKSAAKMAKLDKYKVVSYPSLKDPFESIFGTSSDKLQSYITKIQLGDQYIYYKQIKEALQLTGVQARLPYNISIK
ncbi:signal peptide peptidase SppA [Pedobacter sp. HMF7647]|uniref:Signal peptide peptidase SppA n=1 Tax=Hufsiella arboris TaxID=2695275 RepID=A0A7K1YD72_9SPHI|nr:signal peptide peptidase SppA [Hufsiella arboris]MXV52534.1 signal peptide peptidase SppA [Hufsiella arboris]